MTSQKFLRRLAEIEGRQLFVEHDPDSPRDDFTLARRISYIFDLARRIMSGTASPPPDFTAEEFLAGAERIFENLYPSSSTKEALECQEP